MSLKSPQTIFRTAPCRRLAGDRIGLCGAHDAVAAEAGGDAADARLARRVGDDAPRGEEGVVRGVDRGRPQVVAVDAHRVAVHRGIDPHRGGGLERHARAEDSVAAQNGHLVPEVERLLVAEEGALVALVECGEGFGALREAGAELLQADDVGFLFGDQSRHLVGAAAAAVVVEAADVVGHHLEQTPFGDPPVVHAAEFGGGRRARCGRSRRAPAPAWPRRGSSASGRSSRAPAPPPTYRSPA